MRVTIDAKPDPLSIDPRETAVIAVDMQNDFGAEGGMFATKGLPIEAARATIEPTARVLEAARATGMTVVYLKMEFNRDLSNLGDPDAMDDECVRRVDVARRVLPRLPLRRPFRLHR